MCLVIYTYTTTLVTPRTDDRVVPRISAICLPRTHHAARGEPPTRPEQPLDSTFTINDSRHHLLQRRCYSEFVCWGSFWVFSQNKCSPGFGWRVTDPSFIPCNSVLSNLLSLIARVKRVTVPRVELCYRLWSYLASRVHTLLCNPSGRGKYCAQYRMNSIPPV